MYSLLIDTHDTKVSFVLYKDKKLLSFKDFESRMRHSEVAMPALIELLNEFRLSPHNISEIIVNIGPGSFTGVRIGVVIAKTMAYLLDIIIKPINSIEMLAYSNKAIEKGLYAVSEKNGYFIGKIDENGESSDIVYYSKKDYLDSFTGKKIFSDITQDYQNIYNHASKKQGVNPHLINPLYVKQIEALK